jgi:hypothetical protein
MNLSLDPIGTLVIHLDPTTSWRIPDWPLGARSTTQFCEAVWESEQIRTHSVWANGTYRTGLGCSRSRFTQQ